MSNSKITMYLGLVICATIAGAQAPSPTIYTITEAGAVPGGQTIVYRNGSKALMISMMPAQGTTPAFKTYSLYDIAAGKSWSWNPEDKPIQCGAGTYQGDWGDPFSMTTELQQGIAAGKLKSAGTAVINGITTEIYTGSDSGATEKIWFDKKDDLIIRAEASMPGGQSMTLANVNKVSFAPPPASFLALPPSCAGVKAPPTPAELIADETGDDPANYVGNTGPGSKNSCSVVLRVVSAKTMAPISHIQVVIDTAVFPDNAPPAYTMGVADDGTTTYSGGHVVEITNRVHNGMVKLGLPPDHFMLGVNVPLPHHGGGIGLVYRQCFAPTTVVLDVVKDYGQEDQSQDYLWVKAGKNAASPTP